MYSGTLKKQGFSPDPSAFQHAKEREAYIRTLQERGTARQSLVPKKAPDPTVHEVKSLEKLLEMVSPEDSALIALVLFLLCDNSENDVVLLGILLYVLLSK